MILNISRSKFFQSCRQYAWNWDEERLQPLREADALITGGGYHIGSEIISKTADVDQAVQNVEKSMRERYAKSIVLDEEKPDIERQIEFAKHATRLWAEEYDKADFRVLWPEVSGMVILPNTEHHCWYAHRLLHKEEIPGAPGLEIPNDDTCQDPRCRQPHRLAFRTDGVIEMYKVLYLLEQKTTSSTDRNSFWTKFELDNQVRGYCYGIWKSTGVLVNGVLINAIIKHHKQITVEGRKKYILDPTNIGFEREPVLVTKDDLLDFERDFIRICDDYETAMRTKNIYKNTQSCFNYNRRCYYFEKCKGDNVDGAFRERDDDYVNEGYYEVLGLPNPNIVKEIANVGDTNQTIALDGQSTGE
jgi:hypothetical protein